MLPGTLGLRDTFSEHGIPGHTLTSSGPSPKYKKQTIETWSWPDSEGHWLAKEPIPAFQWGGLKSTPHQNAHSPSTSHTVCPEDLLPCLIPWGSWHRGGAGRVNTPKSLPLTSLQLVGLLVQAVQETRSTLGAFDWLKARRWEQTPSMPVVPWSTRVEEAQGAGLQQVEGKPARDQPGPGQRHRLLFLTLLWGVLLSFCK